MAQPPYLFPLGSRLGTDNLVLHARAKRHRVDNFAGPFSVKTVISGQVSWMVQGRELTVDPSSFLVLPAGEPYSMNIASEDPVETCCVFFAPDYVERTAADATSTLDRALNHPERAAPVFPYLSLLHTVDGRGIAERVQQLAGRCAPALKPIGFEEAFLDLAVNLLGLSASIRDQIARLPATRAATREELFRRLLMGREYFHSQASGAVSLAAVSRAAGVSLFHFHRGFTRAFGETPHRYLTRLRLNRARALIQGGSSVLEACMEVGFSSPSAFSRLFRGHFGVAPSALRKKFARSGKLAASPCGKLAT